MNNEISLERNTYNVITVKRIINSILKNLDYNKKILEDAIAKDKKFSLQNIEIEQIKNIVKKYVNYKEILTQEDIKNHILDGIGNVAVVYEGNPYITVEMALKALYTHNNMIFFPNINSSFNTCLLTIFNESMKEYNYNIGFVIRELEDIYINEKLLDIAIFIGNKYEYEKFKNKFKKDVIYNGYGNVPIYVDDVYFKEILIKIDKYAFTNNFSVYYYKESDINDSINKINEIIVNDVAIILTKDSKKAMELIDKIKARKIYINIYPFDDYKFEFDERKLLIRKQIITE